MLNKYVGGVISLFVFYIVLLLALVIGWVMNIINIVKTENLEASGIVIMQIIGIFIPPIGAVMGWVV